MPKHNHIDPHRLLVKPGSRVSLKKLQTGPFFHIEHADVSSVLERDRKRLEGIQDKLYASCKHSVLIVLQGMDTSGKDGLIKHAMGAFNPTGVHVYSYKAPSADELKHGYLWRHTRDLPRHGEISIFNRSHYENALVAKVHPEIVLNENLPGISSISDIDGKFWDDRYRQINNFERSLTESGVIILKFYLHISRAEQKRRLISRIEDEGKNWKFSPADMKERAYWDDYQSAYEKCFSKTSTRHAPWYVIPSDDKGFSRLAVSSVIAARFKDLGLKYPKTTGEFKGELARIHELLLSE